MELREEEVVPCPVEPCEPILPLGLVRGEGGHRLLGLVEKLFAIALHALDVVHHAVAAGEGVLQFGRHARQTIPLVGDCVHEGLRRREDQFVAVEASSVGDDPFDHRLRRTAAVIADAVEAHRVAELRVGVFDRDLDLSGQLGEIGDVAGSDAESDELAAAYALPDERIGGERNLMLLRPPEDVAGVAVVGEYVGQARRMAEAVDVVADGRRHPEPVAEVTLPVDDLSAKTHFGRQVEVGLDELAAGDVPLPAFDEFPDAGEQIRANLLHLLVDPCLAAGEDELGVLIAAIGRRCHRRECLIRAGLPGPQPDRVDMRIADHMDEHRVAAVLCVNEMGLPRRCA